MDIIIKADKLLNGNNHLLNIIFSYLGQSPSANVMNEIFQDEDIQHAFNSNWLMKCDWFSPQYFFARQISSHLSKVKKYAPLNIPRFKVDVLAIEDDVDCERCSALLTYPERENYGGYCENCYGKVYKMGRESDEEPDTDDSESETDEDEEEY
jgi:hypothetical protein